MWSYRTVHGFWTICEHDGQYVLMFNGECLGADSTPSGLLIAVGHGGVAPPICGLNPASVGLPTTLAEWTCETPRDARLRPMPLH